MRREGSALNGVGTVVLKELADNLTSTRMRLLELLIFVTGAGAAYSTIGAVKDQISEYPFVFLMIFSYFAVPPEMQRRVLLYGVVGAIVMRAVMILLGAWMIAQFSWILYVFGAFLVFTGVKMLVFADKEADLGDNPLLRWLRAHMKISQNYDGEKFSTRINGVRYFTPLMLVLLLIELSDVIFAVDSIPAIFAITKDPFIVFTSNMFAIMGLRALYFLLADSAERFHLLKYGLALVLLFVGCKMLVSYWFHIPVLLSLGVVGAILVVSIALSLMLGKAKNEGKHAA